MTSSDTMRPQRTASRWSGMDKNGMPVLRVSKLFLLVAPVIILMIAVGILLMMAVRGGPTDSDTAWLSNLLMVMLASVIIGFVAEQLARRRAGI